LKKNVELRDAARLSHDEITPGFPDQSSTDLRLRSDKKLEVSQVDARKILGLYLMLLGGLVLFYQQEDSLLFSSPGKIASLRGPASIRSMTNSSLASICSEWSSHGIHKLRRCERSFEASNWGHFEENDTGDENFPKSGLTLAEKNQGVIEYWLSEHDIQTLVRNPMSSLSLRLTPDSLPYCAKDEMNGYNIQLLTLNSSVGALKWTALNKPQSKLTIPFEQSEWKFDSKILRTEERMAIEKLLGQQQGRLLFFLSPKLPQACSTQFKRATLNIRYLEVM